MLAAAAYNRAPSSVGPSVRMSSAWSSRQSSTSAFISNACNARRAPRAWRARRRCRRRGFRLAGPPERGRLAAPFSASRHTASERAKRPAPPRDRPPPARADPAAARIRPRSPVLDGRGNRQATARSNARAWTSSRSTRESRPGETGRSPRRCGRRSRGRSPGLPPRFRAPFGIALVQADVRKRGQRCRNVEGIADAAAQLEAALQHPSRLGIVALAVGQHGAGVQRMRDGRPSDACTSGSASAARTFRRPSVE